MTLDLNQRLLTVDEYHKMAEVGILTEEDRVELLNGQIIEMSPIGSRHAAFVEKIDKYLSRMLGDKAMVRAQNPILLSNMSELEPDIAVVKYKENYYADGHPTPEDIFLIIEVADSSLELDRQAKLPLYAVAGIPEYWIVNVETREIEVYRQPVEEQFHARFLFGPGQKVELTAFDLLADVDGLLI